MFCRVLIKLICLCCFLAGAVFGQQQEISSTEFDKVLGAAHQKVKTRSHRQVKSEERYIEQVFQGNDELVQEYSLPGRFRYVHTVMNVDNKLRWELIQIGNIF